MTEALAWLTQIRSDWKAAETLSNSGDSELLCQEVAKYQQIVEKSIRAAEAILFATEPLSQRARFEHYPERALNKLGFVPGASEGLSNYIRKVLTPDLKTKIEELCRLAPSGRPEQGDPFRKNTEYPYNIGNSLVDWTAPAIPGNFTSEDVKRFKHTANQMLKFAQDIYSA